MLSFKNTSTHVTLIKTPIKPYSKLARQIYQFDVFFLFCNIALIVNNWQFNEKLLSQSTYIACLPVFSSQLAVETPL